VSLEDGTEPELRGLERPPLGLFHGSAAGPIPHGPSLPTGSSLRWGGSEPAEDLASTLQRFHWEGRLN